MIPQRLQVDRNLSTDKKHFIYSFPIGSTLNNMGTVLGVTHHRYRNSSKNCFCGILILLSSGPCSQASHEHKQPQSFFYPGAAFTTPRSYLHTFLLSFASFNPQIPRQGEVHWLPTCQGGSRLHMGPEQILKRNKTKSWSLRIISVLEPRRTSTGIACVP